MLFALAMQPALEEIQTQLGSEAHVLAYLDDVFLLVPAPQAALSLRVAEEALRLRCGLTIKLSKCKTYDLAGARVRGPDFEKGVRFLEVPRSASGPLVGGPVGSPEHQAQTLRNEGLRNAKVLFETLPRLPTAQGGLVLLRSCGVPKFSYFLRVTPPRTGAAVASEFDQALA